LNDFIGIYFLFHCMVTVAQEVEVLANDPKVGGSNPGSLERLG